MQTDRDLTTHGPYTKRTGVTVKMLLPSITSPMKNLLSIGLACSLLVSPNSICEDSGLIADSKKVSVVEYLYADVSDANTILGTIDSGLLSTYQGKDRAAWEQLYRKKRAKLAKELRGRPAPDSPEGTPPLSPPCASR